MSIQNLLLRILGHSVFLFSNPIFVLRRHRAGSCTLETSTHDLTAAVVSCDVQPQSSTIGFLKMALYASIVFGLVARWIDTGFG